MRFKTTRVLMVLLGFALILGVWNGVTGAQDNYRAKATKVTVTEPMQIPGTVLAPGDYVFRLNDSDANRHIVEVWNADETRRITQVLAIPNARLTPTDKSLMTYEERPAGEPVALEAWFYSGETNGQQFVYPKAKAETLSRLNRTEVPSTGSEEAFPGDSSSASSARAPSTSPAAEPTYSASAQAPAPAQPRTNTNAAAAPAQSQATAPAASTTTTTAQDTAADRDARLPNTASPLPLIALMGSLLVSAAVLLKMFARG